MGFVYDYKKAGEVTAALLRLAGGDLEILKLMKLLYLVERRSLEKRGTMIIGDRVSAMPHGPVLSTVYDGIKTPRDWPDTPEEAFWSEHFAREGNMVSVRKAIRAGRVAPAEVQLLEEVWKEFGRLSAGQLRRFTHELPEWKENNPGGSSKSIPLQDILEALGQNENAPAILRHKREDEYFDRLFTVGH